MESTAVQTVDMFVLWWVEKNVLVFKFSQGAHHGQEVASHVPQVKEETAEVIMVFIQKLTWAKISIFLCRRQDWRGRDTCGELRITLQAARPPVS